MILHNKKCYAKALRNLLIEKPPGNKETKTNVSANISKGRSIIFILIFRLIFFPHSSTGRIDFLYVCVARAHAGNQVPVCSSAFDTAELRILRGGNKAKSKITTLDFKRAASCGASARTGARGAAKPPSLETFQTQLSVALPSCLQLPLP